MKNRGRTAAALVTALCLSACSSGHSTSQDAPAATVGQASTSPARTSADAPVPDRTESAAGPDAINGRWCSADPDADEWQDCFRVEVPNVIYDDGTVERITEHDSPWDRGGGVFEFAGIDAPFGTYYPAGVPIEGFDSGHFGTDPVAEDRIWEGQSGALSLRVEESGTG